MHSHHHPLRFPYLHLPGRHGAEHPPDRPRRRLLLLAMAATAAALLTWAVTDPAPALPDLALPSVSVAPPPAPGWGRELPRDWRWQREPVQFEHMYRPGAEGPPSVDGWIRSGR